MEPPLKAEDHSGHRARNLCPGRCLSTSCTQPFSVQLCWQSLAFTVSTVVCVHVMISVTSTVIPSSKFILWNQVIT